MFSLFTIIHSLKIISDVRFILFYEARKALEVLIPDFQKIACNNSHQTGPVVASDRDMQLFDSISVTDPRLYELSVRMALPTPYNLLVECLSRSCVPESDLKSNMISQGRSKHFFTLQLREHTVKVGLTIPIIIMIARYVIYL